MVSERSELTKEGALPAVLSSGAWRTRSAAKRIRGASHRL